MTNLAPFQAVLGQGLTTIRESVVKIFGNEGGLLLYCNLNHSDILWYPTVVSSLGEHRVVNDAGIAQGFTTRHEAEEYMQRVCRVLPIEIVENTAPSSRTLLG
ncbi:hypothetical protein M2366_001860 [Aeromonas sp. BIGb0405]|jgi:hypothetical protein|uniref:hypothetical protein n=1 Tax=Aeromonas TaxID=642 RepID=UPI001CCE6A9F|nr:MULTISPECIES: hypothetical protein [Aeromonas]MCS3455779.1 hypothetical protein [Aeromonas sp. BIGb0405]UBO72485.1 hypothetical protein KYK33_11340 [Aeromonas rivuli]